MLNWIAASVGRKLMLLIVAVPFIALLMSGAALLLYEAQTYQDRWVEDLEAQATILGSSSQASLAFHDPRVAHENLDLLRIRPSILSAALYDAQGVLFASFRRDSSEVVPALMTGRHETTIGSEHITLLRPVRAGDAVIGAVYLHATYGLIDRIRSYAAILAAVMVLSLLAAVTVGLWLQRRITDPIVTVAATAQKVIDTRDFSLRVTKTTSDEIGYLVEAFNTMLAEIGARADSLVAADRMKDQFLATLAHELRNPLAPISNALQILKAAPARPEVAAAAHSMMERQLKHMVRLVDDLLDVSRITTGKLTLRKARVALAEVLQSAVEIARPSIDLHRHRLELNIPAEEIVLDADAARLAQVFSNLLNNAAKYTNDGGSISLTVARQGNSAVMVHVVDNGIGLEPALVPEMFKMFTQADSAIDRSVQSGLGVGLALARRLVEMHGGTIEAHSDGLGCGSRFSVRLPVSRDSAQPVSAQPKPPVTDVQHAGTPP